MFRFVSCIVIALLLALLSCSTWAVQSKYAGKVNEVTSGTAWHFLQPTSLEQGVIIEFYAPWCGHCQQFRPTFDKIAAELGSKDEFRFGACDITTNGAMSGRFDIQEIPTLYMYSGGELYKFPGPFQETTLKAWIQRDYKSYAPLPFWASPLGPFGQMKGLLIHIGATLVEFVPKLTEKLGLPDYMGVILVASALGMSILACTFISVYISVSHAKQD